MPAHLRWTDILALLSFPVLMTLGQFLFRTTAQTGVGKPFVLAAQGYLQQPVFYAALGLYGASTLLWLWLLTRYSLALAYPFAVLAVVFVPLLERVVFHQRLGSAYWAGLALIIVGVLIIVRTRNT